MKQEKRFFLSLMGMLYLLFLPLLAYGAVGEDLVPAPYEMAKGMGEWSMPLVLGVDIPADFTMTKEAIRDWLQESGSQASLDLSQKGLTIKKGNPSVSLDGVEEEAYLLTVSVEGISILSQTDAGAFNAIQSLRFLTDLSLDQKKIKSVVIKDIPRFSYRSVMLDSARHFQPVDSILRLLDQMALLKLNKFHWHLVDNNGWRIPIKSYPRLAEIGGFLYQTLEKERNGVYTEDEIHAIVAYAKVRNIEVIPEVDIPGHSAALVAAYPEFLCPTNRDQAPVGQRKSNLEYHDILCVGNKALYPFLETIFRETIELFGCKTIHIGGDEVQEGIWGECPLCSALMDFSEKEHEYLLQKQFLTRICRMIKKMDVKVINWSERVELGLPEVDYAQVWRGGSRFHETAAVNQKIPTVVSFGEYAYFDYPDHYGSAKSSWMPILPLIGVYSYPIIPFTYTQAQKELIIGGECTLWTEEVLAADIDSMLFPRLLAFGEQMWSCDKNRRWCHFKQRLRTAIPRLQERGIVFSERVNQKSITKELASFKAPLHRRYNYPEYAIDGSDVTAYISLCKVKKGQLFEVNWKTAKSCSALEVITGGYYVYDAPYSQLDGAIVEISENGNEFHPVGQLEKGQLKISLMKQKIKAIRIICQRDYDCYFCLNEVRLIP